MTHTDGGRTDSIWMRTAEVPSREKLTPDLVTDVCIIGAGLGGLTTAYLLSLEGRSVVVIDDGPIGGGETGRTTAHLANALDDRYFELERLHGARGARLAAASHAAAIDLIERIAETEAIDCDFRRLDGYLFVPPGDSTDVLDREYEACQRAGLNVERVSRAPLSSYDTGPCLRFPRQGAFHPLRYLAGLVKAIESRGGKVFTSTHATKMEGGQPARVETDGGPVVTAQAIVVATNSPVNDRVAIHTKQAAYRTYVVGLEVPKGSVVDALYWDTPDPYHYVRLDSAEHGRDVLIVGGEDHKTGQAEDTDERFIALEEWSRVRFPMAGEVSYRWSGQVMEPVDSLGFLGRNPLDRDNVYIITGDSGNGMTHCTIGGMIITDLIQRRDNEWATLYDPGRVTLRAAGEFAKENLNVAAQYRELVTGSEVKSVEEIRRGSGAVVRRGLTKVAVYCGEDGTLHEHSAICPHLGCVVDWNDTEKTWDCPCHGSRFEATGRVLNGPALTDLAPVEAEEQPPVTPLPVTTA